MLFKGLKFGDGHVLRWLDLLRRTLCFFEHGTILLRFKEQSTRGHW